MNILLCIFKYLFIGNNLNYLVLTTFIVLDSKQIYSILNLRRIHVLLRIG